MPTSKPSCGNRWLVEGSDFHGRIAGAEEEGKGGTLARSQNRCYTAHGLELPWLEADDEATGAGNPRPLALPPASGPLRAGTIE